MSDPVQIASCSSHSLQLYPFFLPYFAFLLIPSNEQPQVVHPSTASAEIFSQKAVTDISVCAYQHRMPQEGPKPAGGLQKQSFCPVYLLGTISPLTEVWVWFCGGFFVWLVCWFVWSVGLILLLVFFFLKFMYSIFEID